MLYHFVLTYSNWETGTVCFSESFESQNAIWELGRVPERDRTDRMSTAVNRKPGAFENYCSRDELLPSSRFRMVFDLP